MINQQTCLIIKIPNDETIFVVSRIHLDSFMTESSISCTMGIKIYYYSGGSQMGITMGSLLITM